MRQSQEADLGARTILAALPRGDGTVSLCLDGGVACIELRHGRRKNAVSIGMMLDLAAIVDRLEEAPPVAVIVSGEVGGGFCSGGDLRAVREHLLDRTAARAMVVVMTRALDRLAGLPALVIAAVEGAARGGGAELLTACRLVIAAETATVGFVQARLGVSPGWGGARRLVERVGTRRAGLILAEARIFSALEAHSAGLIDEVVADGESLAHARQRADLLAKLPTQAVATAFRALDPDVDEGALFLSLWAADAHLTALRGGQK